MPDLDIMDRLKGGETLLLDGGTGSELQRRGVGVLVGATDRLKAWSATANIEFADVVQQVHQDYLRVGSDIIISNNFWTIPSRLKGIGLRDQWQELAQAAGENAIAARRAGNPQAYVAGGIAAPSMQSSGDKPISDVEHMGTVAFHKEYLDHSKLLATVGVDVILAEYVGFIADCVAAIDASAEAGIPVFLGVRHIGADGAMQYGESLSDLAAALEGHPVSAVLLMCSHPEALSKGLPILRDVYAGPVGVYPNLGYNPTGPIVEQKMLTNQLSSDGRDVFQIRNYSPSRMAEFAAVWKHMGAQIIGGCCASGPEHIMAMRPSVKG